MKKPEIKNIAKKNYITPDFEIVIIDSEISLVMQTPGGNPDPGDTSGYDSGTGDDW